MPPQVPKPDIDSAGRFVDGGSGILVPRTYQQAQTASIVTSMLKQGITANGFNDGYIVNRDGETLAVKFPKKGGGEDDRIAEAIADGNIANIGVSPVLSPQISGLIQHQQKQAVTTSIELTGRKSPRVKAHDAIARFNDSPLGITTALEKIVYGMCVHNRGAPVATVPILYDFDDWDQYGLNAVAILGKDEKEEHAERFYLDVDWSKIGIPVPYLPSTYDLEPTGVDEWPYWYRAVRRDGDTSRAAWVLLHSSHIIPMTPGISSTPGIGTSPVWMCLGWLAENILVSDERIEKMLYALTEGLLLLGGVNMNAAEVKKQIKETNDENREQGFAVAKGITVITSLAQNVSSAYISFRQPSGVAFEKWQEKCEDITAQVFGEPLSVLVQRGGVGFGVQAETASDNAAEGGVGAILHRVAMTLGAIYPRVMVTVNRPNDRAKRLAIDTLGKLTDAVTPLMENGVLSPEQVALLIEREIFTLPSDDNGSTTTSVNTDDNEDDADDDDGADNADSENGTDDEDLDAQLLEALELDGDEVDAGENTLDAQLDEAADAEELAVLHDDPKDAAADIDDDDVDTAIERADERIGSDLADLLNAEPVDDVDDEE